jgi:hypothetical protein
VNAFITTRLSVVCTGGSVVPRVLPIRCGSSNGKMLPEALEKTVGSVAPAMSS